MQSSLIFRIPKYSSRRTLYFPAFKKSLELYITKLVNSFQRTKKSCQKDEKTYNFCRKDKNGASPVPVQIIIRGIRVRSKKECTGGGKRKRDDSFRNN